MKLLALTCVLLLSNSWAHARGPGWSLSMPTFGDDGDSRVPFATTVGTQSPVNLYTPDVLQDRAILIYNPSANYDRTYFGGSVITDYARTPRWTIGSGAPPDSGGEEPRRPIFMLFDQ